MPEGRWLATYPPEDPFSWVLVVRSWRGLGSIGGFRGSQIKVSLVKGA